VMHRGTGDGGRGTGWSFLLLGYCLEGWDCFLWEGCWELVNGGHI